MISQADVVELLELKPGMTAAAVGAGAPRLISSMSDAVGADGRVHHIEPPFHKSTLDAQCCDRIIATNLSLGEGPDPAVALREPRDSSGATAV